MTNDWIQVKGKPRVFKGTCPLHGEWINHIKDGCVYEQWEEENQKGQKQYKAVWQKEGKV